MPLSGKKQQQQQRIFNNFVSKRVPPCYVPGGHQRALLEHNIVREAEDLSHEEAFIRDQMDCANYLFISGFVLHTHAVSSP